MIRRPPESTRTDTLLPYTTLFRSAKDMRESLLAAEMFNEVHPVSFEPGRIEIRLAESARHDLPGRLTERQKAWTGQRWVVTLSKLPGEPTLAEQDQAEVSRRRAHVRAHPLVQAVLTDRKSNRLTSSHQ